MVRHHFSYLAFVLVIILVMVMLGCDLLESAASDVDGWDLSACVDGFDTCAELAWDNQDRFPPFP